MLHHISWHMYLLTVVLLLAGYYLALGLYFYKQKIGDFLTGRVSQLENDKPGPDSDTATPAGAPDELIKAAHRLLRTAPAGLTKAGLMTLLQTRLAGLLSCASPDSRLALFRYILNQSEATCGIRCTGDDLSFLAPTGKTTSSDTASTLPEPSKNTNHVQ